MLPFPWQVRRLKKSPAQCPCSQAGLKHHLEEAKLLRPQHERLDMILQNNPGQQGLLSFILIFSSERDLASQTVIDARECFSYHISPEGILPPLREPLLPPICHVDVNIGTQVVGRRAKREGDLKAR